MPPCPVPQSLDVQLAELGDASLRWVGVAACLREASCRRWGPCSGGASRHTAGRPCRHAAVRDLAAPSLRAATRHLVMPPWPLPCSSMVQQYLGLFEAASRLSQQPAAALLALMDLSSGAGGQPPLLLSTCLSWLQQCAASLPKSRSEKAGSPPAPRPGPAAAHNRPCPDCREGGVADAEDEDDCGVPAPVPGHRGHCAACPGAAWVAA